MELEAGKLAMACAGLWGAPGYTGRASEVMLGVREAEAGILGRRNWESDAGAETALKGIGDNVSFATYKVDSTLFAPVLLLCFVVSPGRANPPCTTCPGPKPWTSDDTLRTSSCATTAFSTLSICVAVRVFLFGRVIIDAKAETGQCGSSCAWYRAEAETETGLLVPDFFSSVIGFHRGGSGGPCSSSFRRGAKPSVVAA